MHFKGWSIEKEFLEEEKKLLTNAMEDLENRYRRFLDSYGEDDRGFNVLVCDGFDEEGRPIPGGLLKKLVRYHNELVKLASKYSMISVAESDLNLRKELFSNIQLINEILKEAHRKRIERGKLVLVPEEVGKVVRAVSTYSNYIAFRLGRNTISTYSIIREKDLNAVIKDFEAPIRAFDKKWYGSFYRTSNEEYGVIVYLLIDSHQKPSQYVLLEALEKRDPYLLLKKNPEHGLREILTRNGRKTRMLEKTISGMLRYRKQRKLCLPRMLKERASQEKFSRYVRKLFPREPLSYVD